MRSSILALIVAAAAAAGSLATVAAQQQIQKSTVWAWTPEDAKPNAWGAARQVIRAPTPTLDELEIHISTLQPGKASHPPHQHPNEELIIVREGTLDTSQNGVIRRADTGAIIFHSSNDWHNVTNVGSTPATYYVINWKSERGSK